MNRHSPWGIRPLAAILAATLLAGACGGSAATPTTAPTAEPTIVATAAPTVAPTPTPAPTSTPVVTAAPTTTPAPTVTPAPTPTAAPTLPTAVLPCTGSAAVKQWWADQMAKFSFDLYCGVLPPGWYVESIYANYDAPGIMARYSNSKGDEIDMEQGAVCTIVWNSCSGWFGPDIDTQAFGPYLTGGLAGSGTVWQVAVSTGHPKVAYRVITGGVSEALFRSISAKMHRIG